MAPADPVPMLEFPRARRLARAGGLAMGLAAGTAACAQPMPLQPGLEQAAAVTAGGSIVKARLKVGTRTYNAVWYLPSGPASGFISVQHGFSRDCANQRDTTRRFMELGLMALCLNADMSGGNPQLAQALAASLVAGLVAPDGRPVPDRLIVAGHSAGGAFASRLGWALAQSAPARLAGAVLFDPVAADDFTTNLQAVSAAGSRPVLAVSANPSACNASNNAYPALRQVQADARAAGGDDFVGVQLTQRSTHVDSEGNNTNLLGYIACGQGKPGASNTERLRELTSRWAADMASGTRTAEYYPGGAYLASLLFAGTARLID